MTKSQTSPRSSSSDHGEPERQTYTTIVTREASPVVITRTSDGQIVTPPPGTGTSSTASLPASHHYGTLRTTQMTVVETRVITSGRPDVVASSSSLTRDTSQQAAAVRPHSSLGAPSGGSSGGGGVNSLTSTSNITTQRPQQLTRPLSSSAGSSFSQSATSRLQQPNRLQILSSQQQRSQQQPSVVSGQVSSTTRPQAAIEAPKPAVRKRTNQTSVAYEMSSPSGGGLEGAGAAAAESSATNVPPRLEQVPADFSAPTQLPASETTASSRVAGLTNESRTNNSSQPDELTAIKSTSVQPSGAIQQQLMKSTKQGGNPLTSALTPVPGGSNLFGPGDVERSNEDGGSSGDEPRKNYPKKVLFIVANEFCERFSYYGLRTVLVLYFRSVLGFTDSGSTVSFHLFATLCYLTPILGAILGDSILGKYKTILYLSIVYFIGELILVFSSVFWDMGMASILLTWAALILIGIGTGGIKPCVSAFGGDQFRPSEVSWRESFFSLFYGAINLGSLISMFITPMLRAQNRCVGRSDCYPLAFLVPCILMFVSIVVFLMASSHYYHSPLPEKNVILAFCQCTWLALKRKLAGKKLPLGADSNSQLLSYTNPSLSDSGSNISMVGESAVTANKQLAVNTADDNNASKSTTPELTHSTATTTTTGAKGLQDQQRQQQVVSQKRNHWLYLASDRFDTNSIEEFRCCLGIFLLFLPTPVYWALFDQQGSLWTLQATRMDGRLFGSKFILEPDQMMVANPLLLLASIPLFQLVIYPTLGRCNLLTTPIQRMTAGGLLAALTFVASALIEFKIQQTMPMELPRAGQANLILVNGLNDCSLVEPRIISAIAGTTTTTTMATPTSQNPQNFLPLGHFQASESMLLTSLQPLSSHSLQVAAHDASLDAKAGPHKLSFRLASSALTGETPYSSIYAESLAYNQTNNLTPAPPSTVGCPLDSSQANELNIPPLPNQAVRLVYVDQGNGRLGYKLFEDSLALPKAGNASVRLLYEFFGSYSLAKKRTFKLSKDSATEREKLRTEIKFPMAVRDGQVLLSTYVDIEIGSSGGETFTLKIFDETNAAMASPVQQHRIFLEPGTRNLLVLHQTDAKNHKLRQEVLQDNSYRISVLYQILPYLMISWSEVLFSITGLEFSYAMAPPDLKSLILGAWTLTTAFGNLLTVAIESAHPFSNIGYDFLLYAFIMALDMVLFAVIGYYYQPYEPAPASQSMRSARKIK